MNFLPEHYEGEYILEGLKSRAPFAQERASIAESYTMVVDGVVIGFDARPGVLDVSGEAPADSAVTLSLSASTLSELMLLGKSVPQAAADGDVDVQGDPNAADRLLNLFRLPGTEPVAAPAVS
jgi:ubiquinone biosynthesis protein UbiJ